MIYEITVWNEHCKLAGKRAYRDGLDTTTWTGTKVELMAEAARLAASESLYNQHVAYTLWEAMGEVFVDCTGIEEE